MYLWKEGLVYSSRPHIHTHTHFQLSRPCRPSLHSTQSQSQSPLHSLSLFPRAHSRAGLHACLDRPHTHRLVRARFALDASPKRSLPCFLAFWDTARVPLGLRPLILTTARRQFVPRNRRDKPANHTRARNSDKALSNACHSFKAHPFVSLPCAPLEPQLHCCTVVALVPPGLVLSAPPIVRKTRTSRASIPVTQRSFTAAQPVTKPARAEWVLR